MTDYSLSKLFYDLHNDPKLAAEYRAELEAFVKPLLAELEALDRA